MFCMASGVLGRKTSGGYLDEVRTRQLAVCTSRSHLHDTRFSAGDLVGHCSQKKSNVEDMRLDRLLSVRFAIKRMKA